MWEDYWADSATEKFGDEENTEKRVKLKNVRKGKNDNNLKFNELFIFLEIL